ncbi:PEP-CTERM protein-sorting domain-containing protein [Colwellia chukchiensis]|uniref:PEP-CTERM protein-sorting domain-containing protein n=1 Tax=Colwellia chukchiensis TaxID=641665 RepID=A0A1H7JA56_9GAMM|nr:PEP-CTERM sorting domain-containing protein [Colwellia chukchiensis]SEK71508.1 PEP-CTERM protein-sorting domain-containing protein [Colwellia chukchiensis]
MTIKAINKFVISTVLLVSGGVNIAHAGLISIGALTSNDDGSTSVISDSLNDREWLRWDQLADLTYTETLLATSAAGSHRGWTIAGVLDANLFLDALYGGANHGCADNNTSNTFCADNGVFTSAQYTALLGDSFELGLSSVDAAWFYDDQAIDGKAGYLRLQQGSVNEKYNSFGTIAETDFYANTPANTSGETIGWLMYRSKSVPEPTTLAIFAIALLALSLRRIK